MKSEGAAERDAPPKNAAGKISHAPPCKRNADVASIDPNDPGRIDTFDFFMCVITKRVKSEIDCTCCTERCVN